jgi:hypothetical protein
MGRSFDQYLSYATRAARTARSTSFSFASATSDSLSSVEGLMVSKYFFEAGFCHLPPMNSS